MLITGLIGTTSAFFADRNIFTCAGRIACTSICGSVVNGFVPGISAGRDFTSDMADAFRNFPSAPSRSGNGCYGILLVDGQFRSQSDIPYFDGRHWVINNVLHLRCAGNLLDSVCEQVFTGNKRSFAWLT